MFWMKTILTALVAGGLGAQTLAVTGPAAARAPGPLALNITLSGSTSTGPAALQWTLVPPGGLAVAGQSAGLASTGAGKAVACGAANNLCIAWGMNQTVIAPGVVAQVAVTLTGATPPGPLSFTLAGLVGVKQDGSAMAITAGAPFTVTVLAAADLDGDGRTDIADANLMLQQALGAASCANDQNGDGKCDLVDLYIVVKRALGI